MSAVGGNGWSSSVREQVGRFAEVQPRYVQYAETLRRVLERACRTLDPLAIIQTRAKSIPSFAEKIARKRGRYADPLIDVTDLCGARVIVHTAEQVRAMCGFIEENFRIDWANSGDVSTRLLPSEFGYRSVHYIVMFKRSGPFHDDIPFDVPAVLLEGMDPQHPERGLKAEVQVRTILEHAWADTGHDIMYKSDIKVPARYRREFAAVAAVLESADREFGAIHRSLQTYQSNYGKYLKPAQVRTEIETLELVLEHDSENVDLAVRVAGLAMTVGDWQKAIDALDRYRDRNHQPALRTLGIALIRQFAGETSCEGYQEGRRLLEAATRPPRRDAEALCALADSWVADDEDRARRLYRQAFETDPTDPGCLARFLEYEIAYHHSPEILSLLAPPLAAACQRCRNQIEAGVNLPWAFLHLGEFRLLLGEPYQALTDLAKAVELCPGRILLDSAQDSLRRIRSIADRVAGYDWAARFILLAQAVQDWRLDPGDEGVSESERDAIGRHSQTARDRLRTLATADAARLAAPAVIVAGGCDESVQREMESYRQFLREGFRAFQGTIISGGTREGIAGLVGDLRQEYGARLRTVGYVPANTPNDATVDRDRNRYDDIRSTPGSGFTPLEPLQNWIDLVASGIRPSEVRLLGLNGGLIAGVEYRIAAALGARVAPVEESGREADKLLGDPDWADSANILPLPRDPMTLRALLSIGAYAIGDEQAERLAPEIHAAYRRDKQKEVARQDKALADWGNLPDSLKYSNRDQAHHILEKLRAIGCSVEPVGDDSSAEFAFTDEEVERLAEMEHGRWNTERLLDGWRYGETKDIDRKITPYLVAWERLPDTVKQWDRNAVREIPALLAKVGLRIVRR